MEKQNNRVAKVIFFIDGLLVFIDDYYYM